MITLDELAENAEIKEEYRKTVLLTMFKKICVKMENNFNYRDSIRRLFRETFDKVMTSKLIIEKNFDVCLQDNDAILLSSWFEANLRKSNQRNSKKTSLEVKKELYEKQGGLCASCGEPLGTNWSLIHVDHIIPFKLVGDELPNNYQDLCETCNECKSAKVDFIFKRMIKIN